MRLVGTCLLLCLFSFLVSPAATKKTHQRELKCSLCEVIVDEVESGIIRTSNKNNVQSRFRIEEKKYIPYARTEYRIMEILEDEIPNKLSSYGIVRGSTWRVAKSSPPPPTTTTTVTSGSGDPNAPAVAPVDVEISDKNTKKLKHVYEELLFGHTDEITLLFHKSEPEVKRKMCIDLIKACPSSYKFTDPVPTLVAPATEEDGAQSEAEAGGETGVAQPVGGETGVAQPWQAVEGEFPAPTKDEL